MLSMRIHVNFYSGSNVFDCSMLNVVRVALPFRRSFQPCEKSTRKGRHAHISSWIEWIEKQRTSSERAFCTSHFNAISQFYRFTIIWVMSRARSRHCLRSQCIIVPCHATHIIFYYIVALSNGSHQLIFVYACCEIEARSFCSFCRVRPLHIVLNRLVSTVKLILFAATRVCALCTPFSLLFDLITKVNWRAKCRSDRARNPFGNRETTKDHGE